MQAAARVRPPEACQREGLHLPAPEGDRELPRHSGSRRPCSRTCRSTRASSIDSPRSSTPTPAHARRRLPRRRDRVRRRDARAAASAAASRESRREDRASADDHRRGPPVDVRRSCAPASRTRTCARARPRSCPRPAGRPRAQRRRPRRPRRAAAERRAPDASSRIIVRRGTHESPTIYLQRLDAGADGDSGWYVASRPIQRRGTRGTAADRRRRRRGRPRSTRCAVSDFLAVRPDLAEVLSLPEGYVVVVGPASVWRSSTRTTARLGTAAVRHRRPPLVDDFPRD